MQVPRIYGSESNFRAALKRYISQGEDLLDEAEGVQSQVDKITGTPDRELGVIVKESSPPEVIGPATTDFAVYLVQLEWSTHVRRWFLNARRGLGRYLKDQMLEQLKTLTDGLPPDTGKPRHEVVLSNGVPWLAKAIAEMEELGARVGVRREVAKTATAPARFEELHASQLVGGDVIDDYAKAMLAPRTPKQLSDAIGSAKELVEATLRASLTQLGEPFRNTDDLQVLMKKWRGAVRSLAPPDPEGAARLDRALAALANLVSFLGEWRNAYGGGHGRTRYPPGLQARHARLAADAAETTARFIVTTMDDLERLPP